MSGNRIVPYALVALVLVVMGIAALSAYAQKQSTTQAVPYSQALTEIQQGTVRQIATTAGGGTAELTLTDGSEQRTTFPSAEAVSSVVSDYNAAHPDRPIASLPRQDAQPLQWLAQLLIAILPILLVAGLFVYLVRRMPRPSRGVQAIATGDAPKAIGPYAQAIASGDLVFCSGQVALDPQSGDLVGASIREQTRRVLDNLAAVLRAGGSDLRHVVKTTVFLTDLTDFGEMNAVYEEAFAGHAPARATVQVAGLPRGARVEIECIAIRAT